MSSSQKFIIAQLHLLGPAVLKPTAQAALVGSWYVSLLKSANPLTTSRLTLHTKSSQVTLGLTEPTIVQPSGLFLTDNLKFLGPPQTKLVKPKGVIIDVVKV